MRVILLGAPGAGKGTQARYITEQYNIPQISTGEILRAAIRKRTPLGLKVEQVMARGELVDDETIINLVKERISEPDCATGFLLDGFPRTIPQAKSLLDAGIAIDHIIEIAVDDEQIVKRMSGRRVHLASGRTYHTLFNPPQHEGLDDLTGEPLILRDDDRDVTVRNRLSVYRQQTQPLVEFYARLAERQTGMHIHRVSGDQSVKEVRETILAALGVPEVQSI